jgi:two-component system response regulator (stage 0 sporulation protein F)
LRKSFEINFEGESMKKILIVDDEENMRFLYKEELEEEGFMVELAKNGQEALDKLSLFKPDLITLDIKMPGMDGIETLSRIRETNKQIPIIICSAFGEYKGDFSLWQSDAYVVKCADLSELKDAIEKALSKNSQELEDGRIKHFEELALTLTKENKTLKKKIQGLSAKGENSTTDVDQFKSIIGAAAHGLKGEFLHIGSSTKILRELAKDSQNIQEECEIIERSAQYSQLLLQRVLDYLDMGKPSLGPVDILEVLRRTESLVRPRLPSNVELKVTIDSSITQQPMDILGNVEQLMEVLLELFNNAINVMHGKGGTIEFGLEKKDEKISISVRDNGPGIPEELREDLFKKQLASKSGLGLFLCNKVISALKGELNVKTSFQEGTTFTILLPIAGYARGS